MLNFDFNWWQTILIWMLVIVSNIIAFPCFLLQRIGIKAKLYARFLTSVGFDQLTFYDIRVYPKKGQ
jgi:hypothetical protein